MSLLVWAGAGGVGGTGEGSGVGSRCSTTGSGLATKEILVSSGSVMNVFGWLWGRGELAAGKGVVNACTGRSSRFEYGRGEAEGSKARDTLLENELSE